MSHLPKGRLLLVAAALLSGACLWEAHAIQIGQPGSPPSQPGGSGPAGSYNGPGDTVPGRGGPNGYNNLCPCPITCPAAFNQVACNLACEQLLPFDGTFCNNKTCFDPNQPFPVVNYRSYSYSLRYSDWLLIQAAVTTNPNLLDANGNFTVCAFWQNAQEVYVMENLINGHVPNTLSPCAPGMPTVEAAVWVQHAYGYPCVSFKIHEGTFCFLTACQPCGFANVYIDFNFNCMAAAIQWLQMHAPGTLASNPILFNIGFLGCGLCNSGGGQ